MEKELFDNYRFSVRTEVNFFEDIWDAEEYINGLL